MNNERTLREVCILLDISRRAIQGYEKVGLVRYTNKNKYGHLLYDEMMVNRIAFIQFLQQIGFTLKEITVFIDYPSKEITKILNQRIHYLENRKEEMDALIQKTYACIKMLEEDCSKSERESV